MSWVAKAISRDPLADVPHITQEYERKPSHKYIQGTTLIEVGGVGDLPLLVVDTHSYGALTIAPKEEVA